MPQIGDRMYTAKGRNDMCEGKDQQGQDNRARSEPTQFSSTRCGSKKGARGRNEAPGQHAKQEYGWNVDNVLSRHSWSLRHGNDCSVFAFGRESASKGPSAMNAVAKNARNRTQCTKLCAYRG